MNDKELEQLLNIGREQSEKFFSNFNIIQSEKIVKKRIEKYKQQKKESSLKFKSLFNKKSYIKFGIAISSILIFTIMFNRLNNNEFEKIGTPVLQQSIELDNAKDHHLVNYFRIDNPNKSNNLLAILWEKNLNGNYEIIYSSIMENADIPNPVTVINMPSSESRFALVSSSDKNNNFIHYRLIKYKNNTTETYLEENYVPEGKISFNNGILIEERTATNNYSIQNINMPIASYQKEYRYFVPVELSDDGGFTLSTNKVELKKGAILTLLFDNIIVPPEFEYNNKIIDKTVEEQYINYTRSPFVNFQAIEKGLVNLKIITKNGIAETYELIIEIVD